MKLLHLFSTHMHLPQGVCEFLIRTAPVRYKKFYIAKRNGGKRLIAQPTPAVKALQRIAIAIFLSKIPVHSSATAYQQNSSIKKNALAHVNNTFILKLDFKDFFHSLIPKDFYSLNIGKLFNISNEEIDLLKLLFFWRPNKSLDRLCLSIGAPSSPYLSNNLMYEFDVIANNICNKNDAIYTRYSDDIAISTNKINKLPLLYGEIKKICGTVPPFNIQLNEEKTIFTSKKSRRIVTGIIMANNNKISLGRERRRLLRAMLHKATTQTIDDEKFINQLNGYLSFARDIEADFVRNLFEKYKEHHELLIKNKVTIIA